MPGGTVGGACDRLRQSTKEWNYGYLKIVRGVSRVNSLSVTNAVKTYFGPRTECAGFDRVICRTTRKFYNIRTAASFSLMVGLDPGKSSMLGEQGDL
jgi:hypothetical protein